MAVHSIKTIQKIPASREKTWDFFSNPANLQVITPSAMKFRTLNLVNGTKIYPGQIIEYRVSPLLHIPLHWITEITEVRDLEFFIDEQRKGPYLLWRHQHHFRDIEGGTEMTDIVHYRLPLKALGNLTNTWIVKRKLRDIFRFRYDKVEEIFGPWPGQQFHIS